MRGLAGGADVTLNADQQTMDEALAAIYDETSGEGSGTSGGPGGAGGSGGRGAAAGGPRSAGLGGSAPRLAKWLGDIRAYFKEDVVAVIQADAIERKGLRQLLFEPETLRSVQPSLALVGTLMALKGQIPERTKEAAREIIRQVVEELRRELENDLRRAVVGALNRREHTPVPSFAGIDWPRTIRRNLKNYQPERRLLIPERFSFFARAQRQNRWNVLVAMDQSGSMASSVVYGSIMASILASLPALTTRVVAYDTEVVDLTEQCGSDPVDMLFGVQLGGGNDGDKAMRYCAEHVTDPARTLLVIITDLFEGEKAAGMARRLAEMREAGVRALCLLALNDNGTPEYDRTLAAKLVAIGVPCFACTPRLLPELIGGALRGEDLMALAEKIKARVKAA